MALRLAGEPFLALRGADAQGWLREIAVLDSLPGLKINQQGTGRVFDFQDGGSSKMYLPDGGNVTLASALTVQVPTAGANPIVIQTEGSATGQTVVFQESANANSNVALRFRKSEGSLAAPAATLVSRTISSIGFQGYDGSAWQTSAYLDAVVEGTVAAGKVPARMQFATMNDSGVFAERWRITSAGDLQARDGNLDLNSKYLSNGVLGSALNFNGQGLTGGGTFTGTMTFSAKPGITVSVASQGFMNVPIATAVPSAPADGDLWIENIAGTRKLAVRIAGVTYSVTLT
ncbi:MAG: hypothetical protein HY535_06950 [Chloroflexi bacterium]|nr:hypothetical protein [Chloroflexota bacterium]